MDIVSIGAAVSIVKNIPGSAAQRAEAAQTAAETAAREAASHNYGITVTGTTLSITEPST